MRKLLLGMGLLLTAMPVFAADMAVYKAPPAPVVVPAYSGFYFGAVAGGAKSNGQFDFVSIPGSGTLHPTGYMLGGQAGFGGWYGNAFVAFEADFAYDFSKTNAPCGIVLDCKIDSGWFLTQRVVLGATMGGITGRIAQSSLASKAQWPTTLALPQSAMASALMPYVTLGIAERRTKACVTANGCAHEWIAGPAAGGGVKLPIAAGSTVGAEYLYVNYNKNFIPASDVAIFPGTFKAKSEHMLRLNLTTHL